MNGRQLHIVVDRIKALKEGVDAAAPRAAKSAEAAPGDLTVHFHEAEAGRLDLSEPHAGLWLRVLRSLQERKMPAYVEIDERTRKITRLLQPTLQPVGEIHPLNEGPDLRVELLNSHALHVLRANHPQFKELAELLRQAQRDQLLLWVTETLDTHEIIDLRAGGAAPSKKRKSSLH